MARAAGRASVRAGERKPGAPMVEAAADPRGPPSARSVARGAIGADVAVGVGGALLARDRSSGEVPQHRESSQRSSDHERPRMPA